MSPKFFIFVLALVALGGVSEGKHLLKKLQEKHLTSSFAQRASRTSLETLDRKRRDAEEASSSSSATEEDLATLARFFMSASWKENRLEVLSAFLEDISQSDNNITVIGWQRILGDDGKVEEINTIQLVIPPKVGDGSSSVDVVDDEDELEEDDRILPLGLIKEVREVFEPLDALGIPASTTFEKFDREGELESLLYLDTDELYFSAENFAIYNKTVKSASSEQVSSFIGSIKPGILGKPAVLKYDNSGNLLLEESQIQPYLLGNVVSSYEAPEQILIQAPLVIAEISEQYPQDQIPKQLATYYDTAYPDYKWRALVNPDYYYITRDISIQVTYDNFDLDPNSDISYLVYGNKRRNKTN